MRVLLTNDDGVLSPVLYRVADALNAEHTVTVAAPATDQSGQSHSFTHGPDQFLFHHRDASRAYPVYEIAGTPSDCIKFAVAHLLRDEIPELVVSGINLGENAGVSAIYSGTVAAAREAALWGIPSLAVSVSGLGDDHLEFALNWLCALLRRPECLPAPQTLWNINFPACRPEEVVGAEFTAMGTVMFRDHYEEASTPHGLLGHKLVGNKPAALFAVGSDDHALHRHCIAVTPLQIAQTAVEQLQALRRGAWLPKPIPTRPAG